MGKLSASDRMTEERKNLSFFKIFQSVDLSSECMRAFPYNFIRKVSHKDFSYKMEIKAQWGTSWEVEVSKNQRFYYVEKRGWNQFVSDNALGENEFVTFTHKGKMCFNVNIYEQNGKEMVKSRKLQTMGSSSGIKKETGASSFKGVKKEEEIDESPGGVEVQVKKRKTEESKTSKKKMKSNGEQSKSSKKNGSPEFRITIRKSYLKFLAIPKQFVKHVPKSSRTFKIHHPNGISSWKVLCLVRENRTIFSSGWTKMARDYPLLVGDVCTFKLIKPYEILLDISKKARAKITP